MARIVVVGAGIGGLACAARLAADGHLVTVFEQSSVVGGKLGRYERETPEGVFRFDTGPNLFTMPHVFADLFAATGSTLEREVDLVPLDPIVRHAFPDGVVLDSTGDAEAYAERIGAALGGRAAGEWRRLWRRAGRIWDLSWRHILRSTGDSPLALARLGLRLPDLVTIAPGMTLRGLGRSYLSDPHLRMMLDRYATYAGSDPRQAPAALAAIAYAELRFGGWHIRGGLSTLADALAGRCRAHGVEIHTGVRVAAIETAGRRASGVRLDTGELGGRGGPHVPADVVVANADASAVYSELLPTPRRAVALARRSLGGFVMLLGVRGTTPGKAHHTVFFPNSYDEEFEAIFGRRPHPVSEPTVYVTAAEDPALRPDRHEAWFVLVNAPPHGHNGSTVDWRTPGLATAYADRVLATMAARGVDLRDRILFREIRTPADLELAAAAPGGAIYGTPRHGLSGLRRPANRGPLPGLYLVGGSVHPGGGLPMVALSAEIVAARIRAEGPA
jgi:phytoene desaturase